ncbi:hypothetical protein B0T16DRAFT_384334 [Cercophora newfieldiana]|uniref:Uncharacterized protein n=1 Tax=Cercophora newfieldiana TaxID=92897 RepID=A0AA40CYR4_9PEZI|nr:hypothetical protein B0T16DRAFT_384334 [Cercophora newfieldiana]
MPFTPEIEAILRSNPSDNLLVAPSRWTCRHLELLNIEFQELEMREDSGNSEDHANGRRGKGVHSWPDLHHLVALAANSRFVMAYSKCPFRFHDRVFNLPIPLYTPRSSAPRKERKRHHSIPATLALAGCSDIKSPDPHPFIAAALIAAAQSQAGSRRNWRYRERHRYSVCALLDGYPDDENITVYKACISRTFLSKFGFPDTLLEYAQTPSATPESLIIRHMLIPYKPRSTLEDRLLDAIGTVNSWDPYHLPGSLAEELGLTAHPASG